MKNSILKTFLLISVTFLTSVHAEREKRGHPIERLDTDGDQRLSLEEFSQSPKLKMLGDEEVDQLFTRLDKNEDDYLTPEELPHKPRKGSDRREDFKAMDTNQDRKVSEAEFLTVEPRHEQGTPERRKQLFSILDRDQDGFLTKEDRPKPGEHPHRPHGPKGEKRKGSERVLDHRMLMKRIERLDTDQDGKLSEAEFLAGERMQNLKNGNEVFQRMDKNGDGFISKEDRPPAPRED